MVTSRRASRERRNNLMHLVIVTSAAARWPEGEDFKREGDETLWTSQSIASPPCAISILRRARPRRTNDVSYDGHLNRDYHKSGRRTCSKSRPKSKKGQSSWKFEINMPRKSWHQAHYDLSLVISSMTKDRNRFKTKQQRKRKSTKRILVQYRASSSKWNTKKGTRKEGDTVDANS